MPLSDHLQALFTTLGVIALAELGDKTQLFVIAMQTRIGTARTIAGLVVGSAVVATLSAVAGGALHSFLPEQWLRIGGGVIMIGFGIATLLLPSDEDDEEEANVGPAGWLKPVLLTASIFVLAELGDKTMFVTVTMAASTGHTIAVAVGAALGLIAANLVAVVAAGALTARISPRTIRIVSALVFMASGVILIVAG